MLNEIRCFTCAIYIFANLGVFATLQSNKGINYEMIILNRPIKNIKTTNFIQSKQIHM